ncbi:Transposase, IS4 family [hydrothermal vent metagenome]|uniref:Transposase, IS4 family n=1 Tax=hydrothermal vent metagenome TaxID=652676 RepID=A0A3B0UQC7_9ZZZZ
MIGKSPVQNQKELFRPLLKEFIDMSHELVLLAHKIDWKYFEKTFSKYYSHTGQPSMPIRFMVGSLMLKRLYNLGDETLAQVWVMNPYMQYFCGESHFRHKFPCDPSDFVHFRKRIGEEGIEKIFIHTVELHGKKAKSKMVLSDTTVQENNVTFPTDAKLAKKIIDKSHKIAEKEGVKQRQSYKRVSKNLVRTTYNGKHPRRRKNANKAQRKLKTIAGRVVRELLKKLPDEVLQSYEAELLLYQKILNQNKQDKNKIYSTHKPFTACIAKGKAHKQYEFGNKIGIMVNPKSLVILAVKSYEGNPHDSKTIEPLLDQIQESLNYQPEEVIYDRGGRGKKTINGVAISTPKPPLKRDSRYDKLKKRRKFRRRAAIEPVIGHLKKDFRMEQNYLNGSNSPQINAMLAATGWNLKKLMKKLKQELLWLYFSLEKVLEILIKQKYLVPVLG